MNETQDNEIDILSILQIIWDGKWKIISIVFIFFVGSVSYSSTIPNMFKFTTNLQESNQDLYYKYKYLNDILGKNIEFNHTRTKSNSTDKSTYEVFKIDNPRILDMFVTEFSDYDEMITVLSQNEYVKNKIKSSNEKEKRKSLINFAKKFSIIKPQNLKDTWKISLIWHDINEGTSLLNKALNLTLINVKKSLLNQVNNIAKSIDLGNERQKSHLYSLLLANKKLNKLINEEKIRYLTEQYSIAKQLGIKYNQLSVKSIPKLVFSLKERSENRLEVNFSEYPYYLLGYKSIDKEIEIIKNRSKKDEPIMDQKYLKINEGILLIESDNRSKDLRSAVEIINKDNIDKWVNFNLEFVEIENLKKTKQHMLISIILGILFGILFVILSYSFKQRQNNEDKLT